MILVPHRSAPPPERVAALPDETLPPEARRAFQPYAEAHPGHARTLFAELFASLPRQPMAPATLPDTLDRLHVALDLVSLSARGFLDPRVTGALDWLSLRMLTVSLAQCRFDDPGELDRLLSWKRVSARARDIATFDDWCALWPEFHGGVFRLLARAAGPHLPLDERGRNTLESACHHLGTALHLSGAAAAFRHGSGLGKTGAEMVLVALLPHANEFEGKILRKYLGSLHGNPEYLGEREYARIRAAARRFGVDETIAGRISAGCECARALFRELLPELPERLARLLTPPARILAAGVHG